MRLESVTRIEWPAPKGQESLAQGLPWVSRNKRFALQGLDKRRVPALPPGEVNEARLTKKQSGDVSPTYLSAPSGQFGWGGITQGKPW